MIRKYFSKGLFFNRVCCVALAIYLFNFSIDPKDNAPNYIPENLSFNDIESVAELLCEEVLGLTNTFTERDDADADSDSETFAGNILKVFFGSDNLDIKPAFIAAPRILYLIEDNTGFDLFKSEITIPPPKA